MNRNELMKKAGTMVKINYTSDSKDCFAIGWFYAMDPVTIKLKVTSTKYETYENILIDITDISGIETYDID